MHLSYPKLSSHVTLQAIHLIKRRIFTIPRIWSLRAPLRHHSSRRACSQAKKLKQNNDHSQSGLFLIDAIRLSVKTNHSYLFSLDFYFKCGDGTRSCLVSLKSIKYFLIKQAGKARRADLEMEISCERGFGSPWTNFLLETRLFLWFTRRLF